MAIIQCGPQVLLQRNLLNTNRLNERWLEEADQIFSGQEIARQKAEGILHGNAQFCIEIEVTNQEKHVQRCPGMEQRSMGLSD